MSWLGGILPSARMLRMTVLYGDRKRMDDPIPRCADAVSRVHSLMNKVTMAKVRGKLVIIWSITCFICLLVTARQLSISMVTVKTSTRSTQTVPPTAFLPTAFLPTMNVTNAAIPGPPIVVLTSTNAGFLKLTENLLESIKRTTSSANITLIAEDEQSYSYLTNRSELYPGLRVQMTDTGLTTSKKLLIGTKTYKQFIKKRARYILQFLQSGVAVLFADSDTFWVKDPFKDFEGEFDFAAHNEEKPPKRPIFCAGFAYYRPTENTLRLVKEWVQLLDTTDRNTMDQVVLNRLINREIQKEVPGLKIKTLDPNQYPDGRLDYRIPGWKEPRYDEITVVHLSYIRGYNAKVQKFRELGWWLV
ncbi:UDP-D-xylose:L-fucose alpha-1,3-D-xylosyltransferase 1-like [Patiria miniata]|uniref:Nucleotide-diphospho-sugar transferase domain-containing protein n=1 Tax=Patiria miniata TaxID=46514 RepID=A0A914BH24_PATMI|nr:UDP-D-xylose:L-fucose alpha-1,3-D-xylosyltransferase 1-like [Patiria miniata]